MIFYIYEVPTKKVGATHEWDVRSKYNFELHLIKPIILETIEGPDDEDMWQIVGDREWELADELGYERGTHYRVMRIIGPIGGRKGGATNAARQHITNQFAAIKTKEHQAKAGSNGGKKARTISYQLAKEIESKYIPRKYTQGMLMKEYGLSRAVIKGITQGATYREP